MKYITIIAAAAMAVASQTESLAQSKTGNSSFNSRQTTQSTTLQAAEGKNDNEKVTNVSQTRDFELEKENGYYQMPGYLNWGTNAHLNGYPYPVIDPSEHPGAGIDTTGDVIQSGLYDKGGNPSGTGVPVRKMIDRQKETGNNPPAKNNTSNHNK